MDFLVVINLIRIDVKGLKKFYDGLSIYNDDRTNAKAMRAQVTRKVKEVLVFMVRDALSSLRSLELRY